ncbi:stage II sporulation protein M [Priestia flexa]|uniref:Stage II sporulation protein M n=2 Tax=Priestia TaxID=2800373 RepID=A0A0V8JR68_9BACI|nr:MULTISPECIES: stage II sporulation protein M [Bacillaceae]KSU89567.1 stage II sporulation protein M [Priestia veravalensis]KZB90158.1 stage II sporulation protein M [Bacillus sp. VT 712]MCA1200536.1 stage II sporulation protein M [Priestia flexa]MCG7311982.1 stage II sporulation protein M [Priestia flexa]MCM3065979.1 stage II sporulation protein M [Priestia flexa]
MRKMWIKRAYTQHLRDNSSIYLFVTVLFLMGIIFGAIVVNSLTVDQKDDLYFYLNRFFGLVKTGEVATSTEMFQQSFFHNVKYLGLIWILGIAIIGLPVVLILLFIKGMVIGFTVGFLVNRMGLSGFALSFVSVMPQNIFLIPAFLILTTASVAFSLKLIRQQFFKGAKEQVAASFFRYSGILVGVFVLIACASLIEGYVSPTLMKTMMSLVNK